MGPGNRGVTARPGAGCGVAWVRRGMKYPLSVLALDLAAWITSGPDVCPGGGSDAAPQTLAVGAAGKDGGYFRREGNKILQIGTVGGRT